MRLATVFSLVVKLVNVIGLEPVAFKRILPASHHVHEFFTLNITKPSGVSFMQCAAKAMWHSWTFKTAFKYDHAANVCHIGTFPSDYDTILDNFGSVSKDDAQAIHLCQECRHKAEPRLLMAIGGVRTNPADYDDADLVDLFGLNKTCSIPPKPSTSGEMAMIYINDQIIACVRHPIDCKVYDKVTNTWLNYATHTDRRATASFLKLSDDEYLLLGGHTSTRITHQTSLRLKNGQFTSGPDLPKELTGACVTYINPKTGVLAGGGRWTTSGWRDYSSAVYTFDVETEQFNEMPQGLSVPRAQFGCGYTQDEDGFRELYFVGGVTLNSGYDPQNVIDIYSTKTNAWKTPTSLPFNLLTPCSAQHFDTFFLASGSDTVPGTAKFNQVWRIENEQLNAINTLTVAAKSRSCLFVPISALQCN